MPVAKKIAEAAENSSWIRKMFEEGARLAAVHGRDKVFDFSIGNPNLEPPREFLEVMEELLHEPPCGLHGYMSNAGYSGDSRSGRGLPELKTRASRSLRTTW